MAEAQVRVMLNDRALRRARTGVGHYIAELLAALPAADPGIDVLAFYQACFARGRSAGGAGETQAGGTVVGGHVPSAGRAIPQGGANTGETPVPHPGGRDARFPAADRAGASLARPAWRAPGWLRHLATDLYHVVFEAAGIVGGYTVYHEPNHIPGPWPGPVLTTIHDLSVLRHPAWHPPDRVRWYERDFMASLPRSDHFVTVSAFSRREMIELLGIAPERITAIPLGPRAVFFPRPAAEVTAWLASRGWPSDYLLYVGTIEPRKNLGGVLEAFGRLPAACRRRCPLLIVGMAGWGEADAAAMARRHGVADEMRVLGYVDDEALAYLYAGARALVWPTFYEGFGLPPLECMASGTAVITSNAASLPEVVGDAGMMVDPHDVPAISEAMRAVIEDADLASRLSRQGLERSRRFSWHRCAAEHARLYRWLGGKA